MRCVLLIFSCLAFLLRSCAQQEPQEKNVDPAAVLPGELTYAPNNIRPILDKQQKAAFSYFYHGAEPLSAMALEGNNRDETVTIGGSGFGIMALVVGMERGWITRAQGVERIRMMLDFLRKADRYKGVWSHWYKPDGRYVPFGDQEATGDLVETSFMVQGLIVAYEYLNRDSAEEKAIRQDIDRLCDEVDWAAYTSAEQDGLYWLWYSREDRLTLKIQGWNEALCTYLLALGAPENKNISPDVYQKGWNVPVYARRKVNGYPFPLGKEEKGGPLFFAHYSFLGFDPRHMADDKAWYWQQNLSHVMLNRHYCLYEAPERYGYGAGLWGLTACYGAGTSPYYSARSPQRDDGVIAPTAALSSFPYTPFYSAQVLVSLNALPQCSGKYGFADSYMPSERAAEPKHLAIDQGPVVVMIENYRSGLVWNLFMRNARVQRALQQAGIGEPVLAEGFPYVTADTKTGYVDLMAHPDRNRYELDVYSEMGGKARFQVLAGDAVLKENELELSSGVNQIAFDDTRITRGNPYVLAMHLPSGKTLRLEVVLH